MYIPKIFLCKIKNQNKPNGASPPIPSLVQVHFWYNQGATIGRFFWHCLHQPVQDALDKFFWIQITIRNCSKLLAFREILGQTWPSCPRNYSSFCLTFDRFVWCLFTSQISAWAERSNNNKASFQSRDRVLTNEGKLSIKLHPDEYFDDDEDQVKYQDNDNLFDAKERSSR